MIPASTAEAAGKYVPCKNRCGQPEPCFGCDSGDYAESSMTEAEKMTITKAQEYRARRERRRADERALSVDGVLWYEAKMPRRWHRCYPHTAGVVGFNLVQRCACGAIRYDGSLWIEKNARRKGGK